LENVWTAPSSIDWMKESYSLRTAA